MVSRCFSHCGSDGQNSATCLPAVAEDSSSVVRGDGCIPGEIMLFGVRVKVDPMRKSVSMNNLSQYEQPQDLSNKADIASAASAVATGYASADDAAHHQPNASRERKRGVPWTEEEHKLFLLGLHKVGKGDWRGISRNFVKTRTPTQVASHAQKYFLRRSNLNRRRRRSSLFDITTDSVTAIPMEEELVHQDNLIQHVMQSPETPNIGGFPAEPFPLSVGPLAFPIQIENPSENLTYGNADQVNNAHPIPVLPIPNPLPTRAEVSSSPKLTIEDSTLSLKLSLSLDHQNQLSLRHSAFQVMPNFSNGDGMISVA